MQINEKKKGKKRGLWANIHARRKAGKRPKRPGERGYPKTLKVDEVVERVMRRLIEDVEAPPDAPFQSYAFADERQGLPEEHDTPEERAAFRALERHISGYNYSDRIKPATLEKLISYAEAGWYDSVIGIPDATLYRGVVMTATDLSVLAKIPSYELPDSGTASNVKFVPKFPESWGPTSSWTSSRSVASVFSTGIDRMPEDAQAAVRSGKEAAYSVILTAYPQDNPSKFLELRDEMYDAVGTPHMSTESETIALGTIMCAEVSWNKHSDEWKQYPWQSEVGENLKRR